MEKKDLEAISQLLDEKFATFEVKMDKKLDDRFAAFEVKMDKKLDDRFATFEAKMDKKLDDRFAAFEVKIDKKLDDRFIDFKHVFSSEIAEVFHDMAFTIDAKFKKMEDFMNQKFAIQDKKIDLLLEYSKNNLIKHEEYDKDFSKINSNILNLMKN